MGGDSKRSRSGRRRTGSDKLRPPLEEWAKLRASGCADRKTLLKFVCTPRPLDDYAEALASYWTSQDSRRQRPQVLRFGVEPRACPAAPAIPSPPARSSVVNAKDIYWKRLQLVHEAVRPLRQHIGAYRGPERTEVVDAFFVGMFTRAKLRALGPILGCDAEDLLHFVTFFEEAENHYWRGNVATSDVYPDWGPDVVPSSRRGHVSPNDDHWHHAKREGAEGKSVPRGLTPKDFVAHLTGYRILQATAVRRFVRKDLRARDYLERHPEELHDPSGLVLPHTSRWMTAYVVVDIDCHSADVTLKIGEDHYLVPLGHESVRWRLAQCTQAFQSEPCLVVTSPSRSLAPSIHAFWKFESDVGEVDFVVRWARKRLLSHGVHLQAAWIEVPERYRLPLGYDSTILDGKTLQPLFPELAWDTRGKELREFRARMPLPTKENLRAGLFRGGIPRAIVDFYLHDAAWADMLNVATTIPPGAVLQKRATRERAGAARGVLARSAAPRPSATAMPSGCAEDVGMLGVPMAVTARAQQIREEGLTGRGQLNQALLDLNLDAQQGRGLTPEEAEDEIVEILMSHPHNVSHSDSIRRGEDALRARVREVAQHWSRSNAARSFVMPATSTNDPMHRREWVLSQLPQAISAGQLENILSLNLLQEKRGHLRGHYNAERLLSFFLALSRIKGLAHKNPAGRVIGTEMAIGWELRLELFKEDALGSAWQTLLATTHPETGSKLVSVYRETGPQWRYLLGVPYKSGGEIFPCIEAGMIVALGEDVMRARYSRDNRKLIAARARWAQEQNRELCWWDAALRNPGRMP